MNLPELIGLRIVNQINANQDQRVDLDEFVGFFLKVLMGTFDQKLMIAFKCYDMENLEYITEDHIKLILNHVPLTF